MVNNFDGREARLLAMLIDGDNAEPKLLEHALAKAAKYGVVTTRRIYGDWTQPHMSGWKKLLHSLAVQPVQLFPAAKGKNSTDCALIIEAMDLLHARTVHGFCIVSSDSDYSPLAIRIRESGMFVMGIGRSNTPESFVKACEVFVCTENLAPKKKKTRRKEEKSQADWTGLLKKAIRETSKNDGWALLAAVGSHLKTLDPSFEPKCYGHNGLSKLVKSRPDLFDVDVKGKSPIRVRVKS